MTTDTTTLDLDALADAQVPASHFAQYAGFSRVTVALWLAAHRRGELRKMRAPYYSRATEVLAQIRQAAESGDLPIKKPDYKTFAAAMDKHTAA